MLVILFFKLLAIDFSAAIINGIDAKQGEFPFAVSLRNETGLHYCGGALLNTRRHILTAAHCLFTDRSMMELELIEMYKPEDVTVLIGTTDAKSKSKEQVHSVERLTPHPKYDVLNPATMLYDIGIVTLEKKVNLRSVSTIEIFKDKLIPEMEAVQIGWGIQKRENLDNWITSPILQKLDSKIIDSDSCMEMLKKEPVYYPIYVDSVPQGDLICLSNKVDAGIYYRDSGSPLMVNKMLAGLANSGIPCAMDYPDFYTPINRYLDFIETEIIDLKSK